jgi:phasin
MNSPFAVPNELRDLADGNVEQARKAFEGLLGVAELAAGAAGDVANRGHSGSRSVVAHVLTYTEQNVNAVLDLANNLVKAKDPHEVFELQSEYLRAQFAALPKHAKELGKAIQKSVAGPTSI